MYEPSIAISLLLLSVILAAGRAWLEHWLIHTRLKSYQRGVIRTADFFYFLGLPYGAIIAGFLPARYLGLKGLDHFTSVTPVAGESLLSLGANAVTLMLVEWLVDSSPILLAGLLALLILGGLTLNLAAQGVKIDFTQLSILDTIYHSLHWAFYRAVFWLVTGDLYLAVILSVGLVIVEWALLARWPKDQPFLSGRLLMQVNILLLTSVIFFYRPNLWLLWPIHLAMVILVKNIYQTPLTLNNNKEVI